MDKEKTLDKLMKVGHSAERADEIIKEAEMSSNPDYVLHYYGLRKKQLDSAFNTPSSNKKEHCEYCFEKVRSCVCHWNTCAECGKRIPDSHASEYRGRVWCEGEHDFDEQVAKRDFERQEVMAEVDHSVRSQADGEWQNGGYKTMKTDSSGRPITKIKEPARLQKYEGR